MKVKSAYFYQAVHFGSGPHTIIRTDSGLPGYIEGATLDFTQGVLTISKPGLDDQCVPSANVKQFTPATEPKPAAKK